MYKLAFLIVFVNLVSLQEGFTQKLTFSDVDREDKGGINFDIIGKMNSNILVYKNTKWKHRITILDNEMQEVETVKLDFLPEKTFNVDFVAYPEYFYMIYQYQKRNILHCMFIKMDATGKKLSEPVELDTTQISFFADNKIYTTVSSENKEKIIVFKIQQKNNTYVLASKLYDKQFQLLHKFRKTLSYEERRDSYENFSLDNEGNFVFTKDTKEGNRSTSNKLFLVKLKPNSDTLSVSPVVLEKNYVDNINLKIDNLNNRYIVSSFYYKKNRGNIDGIFSYIYDKTNPAQSALQFTTIYDSVRNAAKRQGQLRFALEDFFIRQVSVKKDGGYLVISEDYNTQRTGINNTWNRWDYINNSYAFSPGGFYSPYYGYYRPFNNMGNNQNTRYYCANILMISFNKYGVEEWSRVIQKDQFDDGDDDFLSFSAIPFNGELHFLFNGSGNNQLIADHSVNAAGEVKRNPTLKSKEKGHQFMPKFAKQISAKQIIIPCMYRGYLCLVKLDVP